MLESLLALDRDLLIRAHSLVSSDYALILQILGEIGAIWAGTMLLVLWFRGRAHDDNGLKIIALQIFFTIVLTYIFYTAVHVFFPIWRANPQEVVQAIGALIPRPFDNSFPSGHGLFTGALIASLWVFYPQRWFIFISVITCSLMVVSRVLVGVHYPLDIVGGVVLGGIGAYIISHFTRHSIMRKYIFAPIITLTSFFRL